MRSAPQVLEFRPPDIAAVLAAMAGLAHDQAGWLNLQPEVLGEPPRRRGSLVSLFERRPPELTLATWTPARRGRRGTEPATVGIQHGRPERVRNLLAAAGMQMPAGWRLVQDQARAGLVARIPAGADGEDHEQTLTWLLRAVDAVSAQPLSGRWRALVHRRRG